MTSNTLWKLTVCACLNNVLFLRHIGLFGTSCNKYVTIENKFNLINKLNEFCNHT